MNVNFSQYSIPTPRVIIEKLKEIGVEFVDDTKPSLYDVLVFLQQNYGLIVNVTVSDVDDAIDNPFGYEMHYTNRNGMHSLASYHTNKDITYQTYEGAITIGIINIINAATELNFFK
jgi:hypothetical protein